MVDPVSAVRGGAAGSVALAVWNGSLVIEPALAADLGAERFVVAFVGGDQDSPGHQHRASGRSSTQGWPAAA